MKVETGREYPPCVPKGYLIDGGNSQGNNRATIFVFGPKKEEIIANSLWDVVTIFSLSSSLVAGTSKDVGNREKALG